MHLTSHSYHIDPALLHAISEGDEQSFFILYSEFAPRMRSYFRRMTRSTVIAEDLIQETFIRIWLSRAELVNVENISSWLYTIGARCCMLYFRKAGNETKKLRVIEASAVSYDPGDSFHVTEIRQIVAATLAGMTGLRKQLYEMNREEGLKPAEIAARLHLPISTVKNHLTEAAKVIRRALINNGYGQILVILTALRIV